MEFADSAKFLGIILDKKLTLNQHVQHVLDKSKSKINLLRSLTGYAWGANKTALIRIYRTLVRSRLEYGSEIFNTASDSTLTKLNTVHNSCLRVICGAMKSTAVACLENECGEMPLDLRVKSKQLRFAAKAETSEVNPVKEVLADSWQNHYGTYKPNKKPIHNIAAPFLKTVGQIEGEKLPPFPPQFTPHPAVDLSLLDVITKKDNDEIILQNAKFNMECYTDYLHVFTDGSKTESNETGAGYYIPERKHCQGVQLPNFCSVFVAELVGIFFALQWIILNNINKPVVILSDSVSALQSISNAYSNSRPNLLFDILQLIKVIRCRTVVAFAWVPAHVGIVGNEIADSIAKISATTRINSDTTGLRMPHSDDGPRDERSVGLTLNCVREWFRESNTALLTPTDQTPIYKRLFTQYTVGDDTVAEITVNTVNCININVNIITVCIAKTVYDVFNDIDRHMTALWQHYYDLVPHSNHYKKLEPRVSGRVKFT